jgi:hypothetical protein
MIMRTSTGANLIALLAATTLAACESAPSGPEPGNVLTSPAKPGGNGGGGTSRESIRVHIVDIDPTGAAYHISSDGKGDFVDQICGVYAWRDGLDFMNPTAARIPRDQDCAGVAPRAAYLLIDIRHNAEDPADHSADAPFDPFPDPLVLSNLKFNPATGAGTVNAPPACMHVTGKKVSGLGLRFDAIGYPGSNSVEVIDHGAGVYEYQTRPYPDNMGFCEDDTGAYFVHASFRVIASPNN